MIESRFTYTIDEDDYLVTVSGNYQPGSRGSLEQPEEPAFFEDITVLSVQANATAASDTFLVRLLNSKHFPHEDAFLKQAEEALHQTWNNLED